MKTPDNILHAKYFHTLPDDIILFKKADAIEAMKEYAKQWVEKASEEAQVMGIEAFDYMQYVVDKESIMKLQKEIDAQ